MLKVVELENEVVHHSLKLIGTRYTEVDQENGMYQNQWKTWFEGDLFEDVMKESAPLMHHPSVWWRKMMLIGSGKFSEVMHQYRHPMTVILYPMGSLLMCL